MSSISQRLMAITGRLVIALLLLLALLLAALLLLAQRPDYLLALSRYGPEPLHSLDYSAPQISWQQGLELRLSRLALSGPALDLNARGLVLQLHRWPMAPRRVHIAELELSPRSSAAESAEASPPVKPYQLARQLQSLAPVAVQIERLALGFGGQQFHGSLHWQHHRAREQLRLEGQLQLQLAELGAQQQALSLQLEGRWRERALGLEAELSLPELLQLQASASSADADAPWELKGRAELVLLAAYRRLSGAWPQWPLPWLQLQAQAAAPQLALEFELSGDAQLQLGSARAQLALPEPVGLTLAPAQLPRPLDVHLSLPKPLQLSWDGQLNLSHGQLQLRGGELLKRHYGRAQFDLTAPAQCRPSQCQPAWSLALDEVSLAELGGDLGAELAGRLQQLRASGRANWQGRSLELDGQFSAQLAELARGDMRLGQLALDSGDDGFKLVVAPAEGSPMIQAALPKLELSAESVQLAAELSLATAGLQLAQLELSWQRQLALAANYRAQFGGIQQGALALPGLDSDGQLKLDGAALSGSGQLNSSIGQALAGYRWQHNSSTGRGSAVLRWAGAPWSPAMPLSAWFDRWPFGFDLLGGELAASAEARWQLGGAKPSWQLGADLAPSQLSAVAGDIGLVGLAAATRLETGSAGKLRLRPFTLRLDSLDVGLPIEDIQLRLGVDGERYQIDGFEAKLLDGQLRAGPWQLVGPAAELSSREPWQIEMSGLDLQALLAAADYPDLDMTMRLAGAIPLSLDKGQPLIEGGKVWGMEPGVIRYRGLTGLNELVDLVSQALSNYHYEKLDSSLSYDDSGYLRMGVKMRGANPDLDNGRPIHLNLNVSDNIPNLIKSLQASRLITDAIGTKIQQAQ